MKLTRRVQHKWTQQSLKSKWALTSAFVIFISYMLLCTVMYFSLQSWLLSEEKQSVTRSMEDVSSFFDKRGQNFTLEELEQNESLINAIVDKKQTARILNKDGVEILRINNTVREIPPLPNDIPTKGYILQKERVDEVQSYVATAPLQLGQFTGYIQVTHPLSSYLSLMRYLLIAMGIMGIGALVASAAIGYTLANHLLRPVNQLRHEMNRVATEGFQAELKLEQSRNDEIGELIQVYQRMMSELQQSFEQQQRFISDASHELRTPIQILEGHLKLIQRWGKDDPQVLNESLTTSIQEVERMRSLIEELLDLARREPKKNNVTTNLLKETKMVVEETKRLHPNAEIIIKCNEESAYNAVISRDAYNQIVRNLLQNGIRYSENLPIVRIYLTNESNCHRIEVEDNGIGIKKDAVPRIFDRFFRVDEARSREQGGTGLGLAIVKMLVEKYDGQISVSSTYGNGSKFTVVLPSSRQ
ncbi:MAG: HAMP domain-containing protein [Kurthia sp.]|nr:HAMP domain-containing protein [Candidatus Kurthia equi]